MSDVTDPIEDERLPQASFQGLRQDRIAGDEAPAAAPVRPRRRLISDEDLAAVWVTNPDREMFGSGGPRKLDLAVYYAATGDWMLPELLRRPVSLVRCPTGEQGGCFFQRHASPGMPPEVKTIPLREASRGSGPTTCSSKMRAGSSGCPRAARNGCDGEKAWSPRRRRAARQGDQPDGRP